MKWSVLAGAAIALSGAPALAQKPADDSTVTLTANGPVGALVKVYVDGQRRVCFYRSGPISESPRSLTVGELDQCPAKLPFFDPNFPAPASANLEASSVDRGERHCSYSQGAGHWTFVLSMSDYCPLAAGMAAEMAEREHTAN